jgi:hypothetical protein
MKTPGGRGVATYGARAAPPRASAILAHVGVALRKFKYPAKSLLAHISRMAEPNYVLPSGVARR